jgi:hypothetical protein
VTGVQTCALPISECYDLRTRALVVAPVDADATPLPQLCRWGKGLLAEGADVVEVTGGGVEQVLAAVDALSEGGRPVLTASAPAAVQTGAALVVSAADAAAAGAGAGLPSDRIVLDVSPRLRPCPDDLALGYPLLTSARSSTGDRDRELAAAALAVSAGCRLVRTTDVRGVRRVCVVLAAVLRAEPEPGTEPDERP